MNRLRVSEIFANVKSAALGFDLFATCEVTDSPPSFHKRLLVEVNSMAPGDLPATQKYPSGNRATGKRG